MSGPQFSQLRLQGVSRIARTFGLQVLEQGGRVTLSPCPACNAERRGSNDKRGPVGVVDERGWHCHPCGESGDACDLAHHLVNQGGPWAEVFDACADEGLCDPRPEAPPNRKPRRSYTPPPPLPPPAPPRRPPLAEVEALLGVLSQEVGDDPEVSAFLRARGLNPDDVELHHLARALRPGAELPDWARRGGIPWNRHPGQYRLIAPAYDSTGALVGIHARAIGLAHQGNQDKASQPVGFEAGGLILADTLGQRMLAGDAAALELVTMARGLNQHGDPKPGLVIAEGLTSFLTVVTDYSDADLEAPAVLSIYSGSWGPAFAERIPDGTHVLVAVDDDGAGEKYAAQIHNSLAERLDAGRLTAARWAAPELHR